MVASPCFGKIKQLVPHKMGFGRFQAAEKNSDGLPKELPGDKGEGNAEAAQREIFALKVCSSGECLLQFWHL